MYKLAERGGGVIRAMPERKHSFFWEVFPKLTISLCVSLWIWIVSKKYVLLFKGARGPGVFFIIPCVDIYEKIDLRVQNFDVPPQEVSECFGHSD